MVKMRKYWGQFQSTYGRSESTYGITNDEFCIKHDGSCIANDEICGFQVKYRRFSIVFSWLRDCLYLQVRSRTN